MLMVWIASTRHAELPRQTELDWVGGGRPLVVKLSGHGDINDAFTATLHGTRV